MAKQQIRSYVFTPGVAGAGTIQVQGKWDLSQLLVITNVTRNIIIYNFADPAFAGTTVTFTRGSNSNFPTATQTTDGYTTITLAANTVGQSSTDGLQILAERSDGAIITRPWAFGTDAFERTRTANPTSMLDADFEYGLQPTKWQTIELMRGYPSFYEVPGTDNQVDSVFSNLSNGLGIDVASLITVNTVQPHSFTTGSGVSMHGLLSTADSFNRAEGNFTVNSVTSATQFTYYADGKVGANVTTTTNIATVYTVLRKANFYTASTINTATFSIIGGGPTSTATIVAQFAFNHGMLPGAVITTVINSDNGTNNHTLAMGPFIVQTVPTPSQITYYARSTGTVTGTPIGAIYIKSKAFFLHRPADGGVQLGCDVPSYGANAVRQSKKYIRYQSGKAINYNTGALFAPNFYIRQITATNTIVGSNVYVTCDDADHNLQPGAVIQLSGINSTGYEGTYTVASIFDDRTFVFTATNALGATPAALGTPALMSMVNWHGATVRAGTYDEQNGMYWQYDGIQMAVGLRTSTPRVSGTVSASPLNNLVTGLNTRFDQQVIAGDRVVFKGMSHVVTAVTSATWMYVSPQFRGTTSTAGIFMNKTIDILVPQSKWNIDRCDGSNGPFNPSGYNLNPNKMQMIGLQWTWYGAGFIEYILRGPEGYYITVHRMKNSNVNYEAYMRSGNMPVRYEVINEGHHTTMTNDLSVTGAVMTVTDGTMLPGWGTIYVDNELISYTGRTVNTTTGQTQLTGLTRSAPLAPYYNGITRNYTAGAASTHSGGTGVILASVLASPSISHWGSAFITDGGFDTDRGYIFNYQTINTVVTTRKTTAFGIRLAPSVSNAITGDLGVRDLINKAQLLLSGIEITCNGAAGNNQAVVVEGVLNPSNYPVDTTKAQWGALIGNNIVTNTGQPSFAQVVNGNNVSFEGTATYATTVSAATSGTVQLTVNSTATMTVGDSVVSAGLAGNTLISAIGAGTITISQPVVTNLQNGQTITGFRNFYALPGETIFSFVSNPSGKDNLDLTSLKELTNTPLGGRGCYPNGPDVLFINVYLTQGNAVTANLVLRWGEAQA